ncbi:hypothetical protein BDZ97DRAFT_1924862 [Flammula alnicola]|nr:hypothetical protein BDZ97DRAFT_1924862 [Flammula alnicola]
MFAAHAFAALLALAAPLIARADVTPLTPAPGDTFNEGAPCLITWGGDSTSTTAWKNMAIELMSGDNLNMNHITTVATGQDGTVAGSFTYTCPAVTPNSAIYFYQFTAPQAKNTTWTGRFIIASATGQSTPPANPTQPGSNAAIPWGIGALTDPSQAVAAPSFAGAGAGSPTLSGSGSVVAVPSTTPAASSVVVVTPVVTPTLTKSVVPSSPASATDSPASSSTGTPQQNTTSANAASGLGFDGRVCFSAVAVVFAAFLW